jgi:23S rRNA (guanosine2251-2'-O)-methyltransferase
LLGRGLGGADVTPRSPGRRGPAPFPRPAYRERDRDRGLGGDQVEGRQAVRELLLAGRRKVRELWVANDVEDAGVIADIVDLASDRRVQILEVSRKKLDAQARSEAPQGVLAKAAPLREADLDDLATPSKGAPPPFLVAVDGVTDPGNLGALLRSAEGAGATGVLVPKHRAVHVTPTVAKAAAGAIEHLPIAVVPGLPAALQRAKQLGCWIVGLDDAADRSLFDLDDLGREPLVLVLGAEGAGLSRLVRQRCDVVVAIPMLGHLSSLNVSAAATLACYEVARQRLAR